MRGGAELVALWAQLSSMIELVAGVATNGVGAGLAVLVIQVAEAERRRLLGDALRLGLGSALPVAVAVCSLAWLYLDSLPRTAVVAASLAGWAAIIPGLANQFWLGQERRAPMLALAAGSALVLVVAAAASPAAHLLEILAAAAAAPALALLLLRKSVEAAGSEERQALRHYLLPGFVIGILSPVSVIAARSLVADSLSWHDAGVLQALWRIGDWVTGLAWGILAVYYLPRLGAAHRDGSINNAMRQMLARVVAPAAVFFILLYLVRRPVLAALYDPSFVAPDAAVALVFAGSLVRIASWAALFALYAMRRTRAIALGELLSLPLFAALLAAAGERLTLELAGALWLAAFAVYCGFNFWAMRRR